MLPLKILRNFIFKTPCGLTLINFQFGELVWFCLKNTPSFRCTYFKLQPEGKSRENLGTLRGKKNICHDLTTAMKSLWSFVKVKVVVTQLCSLLPARLCPWDSPGKITGVGCHSLLQGIFPTQGSNPRLLHHRCILYHLNHQESPWSFEFWCL